MNERQTELIGGDGAGAVENIPDILEEWQKPIPAQIATVRHRLGTVEQQIVALDRANAIAAQRQQGTDDRIGHLEGVIESLPVNANTLADTIDQRMDARDVRHRLERQQERADTLKQMRRACLALVVGISTIVPIVDKIGHWIGTW